MVLPGPAVEDVKRTGGVFLSTQPTARNKGGGKKLVTQNR